MFECELFWNLPVSNEKCDVDEAKSKKIKDVYYNETAKNKEILYVFAEDKDVKQLYKVSFKTDFRDIFKEENLIWSIASNLVGTCS